MFKGDYSYNIAMGKKYLNGKYVPKLSIGPRSHLKKKIDKFGNKKAKSLQETVNQVKR